jgi:hypothetical protein
LSQEVTAIARMMFVVVVPRNATRTITSGKKGSPYMMSTTRWIASSIHVSP